MTIRQPWREQITQVHVSDGRVTALDVIFPDGTMDRFYRNIQQPEPTDTYIGKHEKLSGGYKYGGAAQSKFS